MAKANIKTHRKAVIFYLQPFVVGIFLTNTQAPIVKNLRKKNPKKI
jgi:hypothetical protein